MSRKLKDAIWLTAGYICMIITLFIFFVALAPVFKIIISKI